MSYIPEFVRKKCEEELNETPERKKQSIQELRKLLANDKETKNIFFHDDLLVQYLRHSKYNTNKALSQLRNVNAFRNKEAKIFETIPDEYFSTKPSTKFITVLPKRSPDGCTVVLCQIGKWDPNELAFEDFKRITLLTVLQILRDPMTQINGFKLIHDFAGTHLQHLKYCTPQNLYLFYYISIYCIPGRYKEIHLLNETPVLRILWSVIKRFLSDKIRNRVFFHSDTEELLKHFPKSVLPVQYGGEILDMHATNFVQTANKEQKKNTVEGQPNFF
ncbi:Alpha-tocopherol transfer protein-like [Araneus ventricosus]|uniref:Alpha-tocopherol transfer protein-like n=1 Tax=Araneus ventricosus TaxID=182803 RepID=A0A4Y2JUN7_ARAVE|nr:Alpha-tocopherol transfer protein-like [Araneus ventricosus]